jgi:hypothetical protein
MDIDENMNVIEVYVSRLRAKVDKGFEYPLLHTQIGAGYVLSRKSPELVAARAVCDRDVAARTG